MWTTLGPVGLMEARRLRDEFAAQTHRAPAATRSRRVTYGEVAGEWLSDHEARVAAGDLARSTLAGYRDELERHVLPMFGNRQIAAVTPDDLVRWHRACSAAACPHGRSSTPLRRHRPASPWAGPRDIVFASKVGTSPDQRNVAKRGLKIACREAGIEGVSFHVLRHTLPASSSRRATTSSSSRASSATPTLRSR